MQNIDPLTVWHRKFYRPGGGNAFLLYAAFGDFDLTCKVDAEKYRTSGLPDGVEIRAYNREQHEAYIRSMYDGLMGAYLRSTSPSLYEAVDSAPGCLLLRGEIADPSSLLYLRNTIGLLTALLEANDAVGILDMQALTWHSRKDWHDKIFAPDQPLPGNHAVILCEPEEDEGVWIRTSGMRKFGRPDVNMRHVVHEDKDRYIDLCNRFIEMMAFGEVVVEGQAIKVAGVPLGLTCHYQGSLDDPIFNNVYIDVKRTG